MKKRNKNKTGVTMVELVIVISLLSIISMTAFGFIMYGVNVVKESNKEIDLQHSSRMVLYETSNIIRYASAVFTIPKSSFRADNLCSGWDYIGVIPSANGNEIIKYTYNSITNTHIATVLLHAQPGIDFEFVFDKINPHDVDSLLQFTIEGFPEGSVDAFGQPRSTLAVTSEVEARNSLQVIDLASDIDPAYAIAYRNDDRTKSVIGHVVMVLDESGSMADNLQGLPNRVPSRITVLKNEANTLIDAFAQEDNIDIGLVPFATSANTAGNTPVAFYNCTKSGSQSAFSHQCSGRGRRHQHRRRTQARLLGL